MSKTNRRFLFGDQTGTTRIFLGMRNLLLLISGTEKAQDRRSLRAMGQVVNTTLNGSLHGADILFEFAFQPGLPSEHVARLAVLSRLYRPETLGAVYPATTKDWQQTFLRILNPVQSQNRVQVQCKLPGIGSVSVTARYR